MTMICSPVDGIAHDLVRSEGKGRSLATPRMLPAAVGSAVHFEFTAITMM